MKKNLFYISTILLITLTACNKTHLNYSLSPTTQTKSQLLTQEEEQGGNPEVYIAHQCLKSKLAQSCLEQLFSDERKAYIESYEIIKLAGRGSSTYEATIEIKDDDLFLLYLDSSKVKAPLNVNIKSAKISQDEHSVLFILPVQDIKQEIVVKNKNNEIILRYKIFRKH